MAQLAPARRVAAGVLKEQRVREARARDVMRGSDAVAALDERDRALATRLALGVVRTSGLLDQVIAKHLRKGVKLEPRVRDALRLGAFELLYLGTPAEVAVSQGVELARAANRRVAGLANAVLRRVAEEDVAALAAARERVQGAAGGAPCCAREGDGFVADVALVGALPLWLARELVASCGTVEAASLALAALDAPLATVVGNRSRWDDASIFGRLSEAGCEPSAGPLAGTFVLGRQGGLAPSGLVEAVDVMPCDLAAQEVAQMLSPAPGSHVLEVGQGRGTKTLLLQNAAVAEGGPCEVVAVELDAWKSRLSERRMTVAGLGSHVTCVTMDACELDGASLPVAVDQAFDLVFVDAPCTGTGTLARHPEIAWSLEPGAAHELAALQLQILSAASVRVALGKELAYATCSVLREENEHVVEAFLASEKGVAFELAAPMHRTEIPGADRHFLARLRRRS